MISPVASSTITVTLGSNGTLVAPWGTRAVAGKSWNTTAQTSKSEACDAVDPETILEQVGLRFSVGREDLIGTSRKKGIAEPRRIAMYLMHEELAMSHTDIGRLMGGRNHSTVISALSKVNRSLHTDPSVKNHIMAVKDALISPIPN